MQKLAAAQAGVWNQQLQQKEASSQSSSLGEAGCLTPLLKNALWLWRQNASKPTIPNALCAFLLFHYFSLVMEEMEA